MQLDYFNLGTKLVLLTDLPFQYVPYNPLKVLLKCTIWILFLNIFISHE